jgi:hypothetical protein
MANWLWHTYHWWWHSTYDALVCSKRVTAGWQCWWRAGDKFSLGNVCADAVALVAEVRSHLRWQRMLQVVLLATACLEHSLLLALSNVGGQSTLPWMSLIYLLLIYVISSKETWCRGIIIYRMWILGWNLLNDKLIVQSLHINSPCRMSYKYF